MKNYWENRWGLLESSIIYPPMASIRSNSTFPGSLAVLWGPAEFDACSRSPGHFWLLALCLSPWWVCSAAWSARREGANHTNLTHWHECFCSVQTLSLSSINNLGSTSFFDNVVGSKQLQVLGKVRILFWCISHLEKCYKNMKSLLERVGNFISLFFSVTKDKCIQTVVVCGKWDGFNKFSSLQNYYKSSKPIFFFF